MRSTTNQTLSQLRKAVDPVPRVTLTELARSTKWRDRMVEYAVIELCDHSETAGYLVSPVGMRDILDRLEELEHELEEVRLAAIVAERANYATWESGEQLAAHATSILQSQESALESVNVS